MKTVFILILWAGILLPKELHAFYSIAEMKAEALRKDPSIKIRVHESGDQVTFIVALRKSDNQDVYSHGSLELVNPEGVVVGTVEMRGEDIRRAINYEALRAWGWQDIKPAEVFRFTIHSHMLTRSKFSRETGPRNDERGMPYAGGIIRWSILKDLAEAAENANQPVQRTGASRSAQGTNRTSSAAGSRR
jgi:hypothetical protein